METMTLEERLARIKRLDEQMLMLQKRHGAEAARDAIDHLMAIRREHADALRAVA